MNEVKVLGTSESGRSVIIDIGEYEGIKQGEKAGFYLQEGIENAILTNLGHGEVVKVFPNFSYWHLKLNLGHKKLKKNQKILISTFDMVLGGNSPVKVLKKERVHLNANKAKETAKSIPDKYKYKDRAYKKSPEHIKTDVTIDHDLVDVKDELWKEQSKRQTNDDKREIEALRREAPTHNTEEIVDIFDQDVFEEASEASIKYNNKLSNERTSVHSEREKDETSFLNMTELQKKENAKEVYLSPRAILKLRNEKDMWSRNMNDKQLRQYMVQSGIVHEVNRRVHALENRVGNELLFRYAFDLTENTTVDDPENRNVSYSLGIGYEYHLARVDRDMKSWSIDFIFQSAYDHYDVGGINVKSNETSFRSALNYYLYNYPSTIRKFIWYGGIGLRAGNAIFTHSGFVKDYLYELRSMPSAHFGMKYRFSAGDEKNDVVKLGYGINLLLISESVKFNINDTLQDGDNIEQNFTINDLRFSAGLSVYF